MEKSKRALAKRERAITFYYITSSLLLWFGLIFLFSKLWYLGIVFSLISIPLAVKRFGIEPNA
jgi:hypothetical protein